MSRQNMAAHRQIIDPSRLQELVDGDFDRGSPNDENMLEPQKTTTETLLNPHLMRAMLFVGGSPEITKEDKKATSAIVDRNLDGYQAGNDAKTYALDDGGGDNDNLDPILTIARRVFEPEFKGDLFDACGGVTEEAIRTWMLSDSRVYQMRLHVTTSLLLLRASSYLESNEERSSMPFQLFRPCFVTNNGQFSARFCYEAWENALNILTIGQSHAKRLELAKQCVVILKAIVKYNNNSIPRKNQEIPAEATTAFRKSLQLGEPPVPDVAEEKVPFLEELRKECTVDGAERPLAFANVASTTESIIQACLATTLNRLRSEIKQIAKPQGESPSFQNQELPLVNFVNSLNYISIRNEVAYKHICKRLLSPTFKSWRRHYDIINEELGRTNPVAGETFHHYLSLLVFLLCVPVPAACSDDLPVVAVFVDCLVDSRLETELAREATLVSDIVGSNKKRYGFSCLLPVRRTGTEFVQSVLSVIECIETFKYTRHELPLLYPVGSRRHKLMRRITTNVHMGVLRIENNTAIVFSELPKLHMNTQKKTPERLLLIRTQPELSVVDFLQTSISSNAVVLSNDTDNISAEALRLKIEDHLYRKFTAAVVGNQRKGFRQPKEEDDDDDEDEDEDEEDEVADEDINGEIVVHPWNEFDASNNFAKILRASFNNKNRPPVQVTAKLHMDCWESQIRSFVKDAIDTLGVKTIKSLIDNLRQKIGGENRAMVNRFVKHAVDVVQLGSPRGNGAGQTFSEATSKLRINSKHEFEDAYNALVELGLTEANSRDIDSDYWHTKVVCAIWISLVVTEVAIRGGKQQRQMKHAEMGLDEPEKKHLIDAWRLLISWIVQMPIAMNALDNAPRKHIFRGRVWDETQYDQMRNESQTFMIQEISRHYLNASSRFKYRMSNPIPLLGTAVLPMHALKLIFLEQVTICDTCNAECLLDDNAHKRWTALLENIKLLCAMHDMQTYKRLYSRASLPLYSKSELLDSQVLAEEIHKTMTRTYQVEFQLYLTHVTEELPKDGEQRKITAFNAWWGLFTKKTNYTMTTFDYWQSVQGPSAAAEMKDEEKKLILDTSEQPTPLFFTPARRGDAGAEVKHRTAELLLAGAIRAIPVATLVDLNRMVKRVGANLRAGKETNDVVTEMLIAARITAAVEYCFCTKGVTIETLLNRGSWLNVDIAADDDDDVDDDQYAHKSDSAVSDALDALIRQMAMQFAIRILVANDAKVGCQPTFVLLLCSEFASHFSRLASEIVAKMHSANRDDRALATAFLKLTGIGAPDYDPQQPISLRFTLHPQSNGKDKDAVVLFRKSVRTVVNIIYEAASIVVNTIRITDRGQSMTNVLLTSMFDELKGVAGAQKDIDRDAPADAIKPAIAEEIQADGFEEANRFRERMMHPVLSDVLATRLTMRKCFDVSDLKVAAQNVDSLPKMSATLSINNLSAVHKTFIVVACETLLRLRSIGPGFATASWLNQLRDSLVFLTELALVGGDGRAYARLKTEQLADIVKKAETDQSIPSAICSYWNDTSHIVQFATALFERTADAVAAADADANPKSNASDESDNDDDDADEGDDDDDSGPKQLKRTHASGNYMFSALGNVLVEKFGHSAPGAGADDDAEEQGGAGGADDGEDQDEENGKEPVSALTYAPLSHNDLNVDVIDFINSLVPQKKFTVWFSGMEIYDWKNAMDTNQFNNSKFWNRYLYGGPHGQTFIARSTFEEEKRGLDALIRLKKSNFKGRAEDFKDLVYLMRKNKDWQNKARKMYEKMVAVATPTDGRAFFIVVFKVFLGREARWCTAVVLMPTPFGNLLMEKPDRVDVEIRVLQLSDSSGGEAPTREEDRSSRREAIEKAYTNIQDHFLIDSIAYILSTHFSGGRPIIDVKYEPTAHFIGKMEVSQAYQAGVSSVYKSVGRKQVAGPNWLDQNGKSRQIKLKSVGPGPGLGDKAGPSAPPRTKEAKAASSGPSAAPKKPEVPQTLAGMKMERLALKPAGIKFEFGASSAARRCLIVNKLFQEDRFCIIMTTPRYRSAHPYTIEHYFTTTRCRLLQHSGSKIPTY